MALFLLIVRGVFYGITFFYGTLPEDVERMLKDPPRILPP
jgi:hypothetical protein